MKQQYYLEKSEIFIVMEESKRILKKAKSNVEIECLENLIKRWSRSIY